MWLRDTRLCVESGIVAAQQCSKRSVDAIALLGPMQRKVGARGCSHGPCKMDLLRTSANLLDLLWLLDVAAWHLHAPARGFQGLHSLEARRRPHGCGQRQGRSPSASDGSQSIPRNLNSEELLDRSYFASSSIPRLNCAKYVQGGKSM